MAKNVKRVPFPDYLCKTPCTIKLDTGGLTEDGEAAVYKNGIETNCIYSERAKRIYDKDGKSIILSGRVIVKGDIAPTLETVSSGCITISKRKMMIHTAYRPRNPDGTVHHTEFEVV